jgi:hypothetical protein
LHGHKIMTWAIIMGKFNITTTESSELVKLKVHITV